MQYIVSRHIGISNYFYSRVQNRIKKQQKTPAFAGIFLIFNPGTFWPVLTD